MSDELIAAIARRLAEASAASAYERTPETKSAVSRHATELVQAVREEVVATGVGKVQP
jgi:hypothetical protein